VNTSDTHLPSTEPSTSTSGNAATSHQPKQGHVPVPYYVGYADRVATAPSLPDPDRTAGTQGITQQRLQILDDDDDGLCTTDLSLLTCT